MSDENNWNVGYGKPPKHAQFKRGQSGNPRGRPKGSINYKTRFHRIINEQVTVNENGRRKKSPKFDVAMRQVVNKAVTADFKALNLLRQLYQIFAREEDRAEPLVFVISKNDAKL
jgi:Family of unknown function (DUF5681)